MGFQVLSTIFVHFFLLEVMAEVRILPESKATVNVNATLTFSCIYTGQTDLSVCIFWRNEEQIAILFYPNCNHTPRPLYNASCPGRKECSASILSTSVEENGVKWKCEVRAIGDDNYTNSPETEVSIAVPIASVSITVPENSTMTVRENTEAEIKCKTSGGLPAANITWYKTYRDSKDDLEITSHIESTTSTINNLIVVTSTLRYSPSRNENGCRIYCKASNVLGQTVLSTQEKLFLNVTYPPELPVITGYPTGSEYRVIENKHGRLSCSVTGGNPAPTLTWNCFNSGTLETTPEGTVTKTQTWIAQRNHNRTCTCRSIHYSGERTVTIKIKTLYPPTKPKFKINSAPVSATVKVIRNNPLSVIGNSLGIPSPTYSWTNPNGTVTTGQELRVTKVPNKGTWTYTCNVNNLMNSSDGLSVRGINASSLDVHVLYPPSVEPFHVDPVEEGSRLAVECKTIPGSPANTTYSWKRKLNSASDNTWQDIPGSSIDNGTLLITNIHRSDAGTYNCTAFNSMKPTAEQEQIGSNSQKFMFRVLYKASISSFIEVNHPANQAVTVAENSSITFQCIVDSNPGSNISILKDDEIKVSQGNKKQISYPYSKVVCSTAGIYKCVGYNDYNTEESKPLRTLRLFVTCSPRLLSPENFVSNVTSALNDEAQLMITVVAYPVPKESDYVWSKWNGTVWKTLKNDNFMKINSSGLDSRLTFLSIKQSDYQQYRVNVKNSFGHLYKEFFLSPFGKPNPPEKVNVMEGSLKETAAKITWTPGFNGGPEQTFVVQYKKQGESTWLEFTKDDENTESMNASLTGLVHGTTYSFRMYSKNTEGNSTFTNILTFQTIEKTEPKSPAALIGGVTGGSIVLITLLIVVVLLVRRSSIKKGKSKASSEGNDRKPVCEDENDYGMQDNPMYVSAGPRKSTSTAEDSSSVGAAVYSTVNKPTKANNIDNDNEYAEVKKTNKAKAKQGKKEKEKSKQGFFKDKKGKLVQEGDIYENAPSKDLKATSAKDETIYENPESSLSHQKKKNVNKDGLIYADLTFNDQPKGQKKLVIHGLDSMTEYVEVDFSKKADPLPDSDDENIPPKK